MAGRRRAAGTAGALRSCRPGAADCMREFRELADGASGCGATGIGDPGGARRGPRSAHPENADREHPVVGPGRGGWIVVGEVGHEHAADPEAGTTGTAEWHQHGYTSAAVRARG